MKTQDLPEHLRKYAINQSDRQYTSVDQAVWRFILRQLKSYLGVHAHPNYLSGLEKTGISIEHIPQISDVSAKLEKFGWKALPVSGFLPPAAFMELQALNVLPIASDIRSLDHLLYTPAPDIVHEAAGHAPLIADPEYAQYLRNYAQVARKAIMSKYDMEVYGAIRLLSDLKENPKSTMEQIHQAEENLKLITAREVVSEATWLSRMNWWTAEYGLIGSLEKPRIFGAGLLSSVGEAKLCLSPKVKKLPLTIDCINYSYDITEPQPQLFVTPDFKTLNKVLGELSERMAFQIGGVEGVQRAIEAQTVNTVELSSGAQVSGLCTEVIHAGSLVSYLIFKGPCQLSENDQQLPGHGREYHKEGFGTPVGELKTHPNRDPSKLSDNEWYKLGAVPNGKVKLEYASGLIVTGDFNGRFEKAGKTQILSLTNAKAILGDRLLFQPAWGTFDILIGATVTSVFGGPADREAYGEVDDFKATQVAPSEHTKFDQQRFEMYSKVRKIREDAIEGEALTKELTPIFEVHKKAFPPTDWLLNMEMLELLLQKNGDKNLIDQINEELKKASTDPSRAATIQDGLALAEKN